jgi:hypothetical protein
VLGSKFQHDQRPSRHQRLTFPSLSQAAAFHRRASYASQKMAVVAKPRKCLQRVRLVFPTAGNQSHGLGIVKGGAASTPALDDPRPSPHQPLWGKVSAENMGNLRWSTTGIFSITEGQVQDREE